MAFYQICYRPNKTFLESSIMSISKSGGRQLTVKLKTARGRKTSSQRWLQRQLNDPYVCKAKELGYRSRAAFKLLEMNEKINFLSPGKRVVDLGAAPGGWTQVAIEIVKPQLTSGYVLGLDLQEMDPIAGATLLQLDFLEDDAEDIVIQALGGQQADVVLSDMAAFSTGHSPTDHLKIMGLAETAFAFAEKVLAPGGTFLAKVLQGGTENMLLNRLKHSFKIVKHLKPPASRKDSSEMYVIALEFKGRGSESI
jgi:23S rRNA (uridine2552-2'-O)-methyltransferase